MVHICDTEYTEFEGDYDVILIENETYMHYFDAQFIAFLHFFFFIIYQRMRNIIIQ